jgi:hypothetical protein
MLTVEHHDEFSTIRNDERTVLIAAGTREQRESWKPGTWRALAEAAEVA